MQSYDLPNRNNRHNRNGNVALVVIGAVVVICAGLWIMKARGYWPFSETTSNPVSNATTHTVKREQLVVTVTEDGNIESAKNIDIKCEIAGGSTILSIIADGTLVEAGQELVQLDQSGIEEQLRSQKGIYEKALAAQIQATEDAKAASIAVQEYSEGVFVKEMQLIEGQIKIAMENMRSAENILDHSRRMSRKGFVTPLQVEADEFAVQRAHLDLDAAKTSKSVLEKFTREKMLKELEGKRDAAKARARSENANVELEEGKLKKLTNQLAKTTIRAPQAGMVVYYKESSGRFGGQQTPIAEGTPVREAQTIIQLPDLKRMQAKVPIHESKVDIVRSGMRVLLKVLDREFQGTVVLVANQPESKSWAQAQVKEYPAVVRIDSDTGALRPGMTTDVEILVADLTDVLTIPVAAVVDQNSKHVCWVVKNGSAERRELLLGMTNDKMVEVKDGLAEGDEVIMNPRTAVADALKEEKVEEKSIDTKSKYGAANAADSTSGGVTGGPTAESGGGNRPRGPQRLKFSELDKNKDNKIDKDEAPEDMKQPIAFLGNKTRFELNDEDGDGFITQAEADAVYKKTMERMQQGGQRGAGGPRGPGAPAGGPQT